jgi:hypothetical protein
MGAKRGRFGEPGASKMVHLGIHDLCISIPMDRLNTDDKDDPEGRIGIECTLQADKKGSKAEPHSTWISTTIVSLTLAKMLVADSKKKAKE